MLPRSPGPRRAGEGGVAMSTTQFGGPGLRPVSRGERIDFLDTARGLALLGILFVNIQAFAEPFGRFIEFNPGPGVLNQAGFAFVKIFCEGKFYPLFSTLFGIGLALQWARAHEAGRSYKGAGLRRLFFLMLIGAAHAFLLWYGDILLAYSVCGLIVLPALRLRPATLAAIGAAVLAIATVLNGLVSGTLEPAKPEAPVVAAEPAPASGPGVLRMFGEFERRHVEPQPDHPIWMEAETRAFKEGPFIEALAFRAFVVVVMLVFYLLGFGWSIIAMFLFGAAMLKAGVVARPAGPLVRRLFFIGLPVGLAGSVASFVLLQGGPGMAARIVMGLVAMPSAVLMSLGYFSGVKLWVESGRARAVAGLLGNVGRFGLTNYIMQTVICTFVFYHWGLGLFGEFTRPQRLAMVVSVYAFQVVLSAGLARLLAYGPLEWVWRTATYLRPQPFLRRAAGAD